MLAIFQVPNKFFEADGRVTDISGADWDSVWGPCSRIKSRFQDNAPAVRFQTAPAAHTVSRISCTLVHANIRVASFWK